MAGERNKRVAALIVAKMHPDQEEPEELEEVEESSEQEDPGLRSAAEELLLAVRNEDPVGVMKAMQAHHEILDAQREAEGEDEEEPEGYAKGGRVDRDSKDARNWEDEDDNWNHPETYRRNAEREKDAAMEYPRFSAKRMKHLVDSRINRDQEDYEREYRHKKGLHGPGYAEGGAVASADQTPEKKKPADPLFKSRKDKKEVNLSGEGDSAELNAYRQYAAPRVGGDPDRVADFSRGGRAFRKWAKKNPGHPEELRRSAERHEKIADRIMEYGATRQLSADPDDWEPTDRNFEAHDRHEEDADMYRDLEDRGKRWRHEKGLHGPGYAEGGEVSGDVEAALKRLEARKAQGQEPQTQPKSDGWASRLMGALAAKKKSQEAMLHDDGMAEGGRADPELDKMMNEHDHWHMVSQHAQDEEEREEGRQRLAAIKKRISSHVTRRDINNSRDPAEWRKSIEKNYRVQHDEE